MGYAWETALTAVFVEGIIFILLSVTSVREAIFNAVPRNLKSAVSVGIGLFIAFIGLQNAKIVIGGATLVELFSIEKIYNHRAVVEIENAGYNVMYELLDHFIPSVIKENPKNYDKKALQLLPEQFRYEGEPYEKIMGVLDFVSGMTDNYATDLYRKIKGIDIGMTM